MYYSSFICKFTERCIILKENKKLKECLKKIVVTKIDFCFMNSRELSFKKPSCAYIHWKPVKISIHKKKEKETKKVANVKFFV